MAPIANDGLHEPGILATIDTVMRGLLKLVGGLAYVALAGFYGAFIVVGLLFLLRGLSGHA